MHAPTNLYVARRKSHLDELNNSSYLIEDKKESIGLKLKITAIYYVTSVTRIYKMFLGLPTLKVKKFVVWS